MARIAVGGFQHETNTFAPAKATFADFERAGAWPGLVRGRALLEGVRGINLPIAGFIEEARRLGHEVLPLSWAQATPSAHVTSDAFARILNQILEDLSTQVDLDGVYLDLHGAMVTEHLHDGEAVILEQVRALVGNGLPLVASLDLHANVSPEMVKRADALISFRTYPHVDMAETGARAARHLDFLLAGGKAQHRALRQLPFLLPLTGGCTLVEPGKAVYAELEALEGRNGVAALSFNCGFPPADIPNAGPSVIAYGASETAASNAADALADFVLAREAEFAADIFTAEAAVAEARRIARYADAPVVLADTQDNPGAGGEGDTTGLLEELVRQDAERAVVAMLHDPAAACAAHAAGRGQCLDLELGNASGWAGQQPFRTVVKVEALGDGSIVGTGPFYKGAHIELGPMALLRIADSDVRVVIASRKMQAADQAVLRHLGVEPRAAGILALKSSVHFRADFQPIAAKVMVAAAPGPNPVDHTCLAYRHLRSGVRLMPNGPTFLGPTHRS
ncbi:M81 family metallopeptidase [Ferruginivarius sediminum]|uniref:Microcystinase C n=1 Tax=Ferruginivarius sediminum TaxID=2661937 RepID=A0A369T7W5_9PROT|nr:M81 family metallopeptidase [Ferruginivarius sediminum]RDD61400.1 microcystin degradation protein MlrC [Ferruginivarius sediminum]